MSDVSEGVSFFRFRVIEFTYKTASLYLSNAVFVEVIIELAILAADAFCVVGVVKLVLLTFGGVTFVFFFKLFMVLGNEIFDTAFVDILGVANTFSFVTSILAAAAATTGAFNTSFVVFVCTLLLALVLSHF